MNDFIPYVEHSIFTEPNFFYSLPPPIKCLIHENLIKYRTRAQWSEMAAYGRFHTNAANFAAKGTEKTLVFNHSYIIYCCWSSWLFYILDGLKLLAHLLPMQSIWIPDLRTLYINSLLFFWIWALASKLRYWTEQHTLIIFFVVRNNTIVLEKSK